MANGKENFSIGLLPPDSSSLVDLTISKEAIADSLAYATKLRSVQLSERSVCDLELLANGAFSPLDRFMSYEDHERVVDEMRLANGAIFPIPIILPVNPQDVSLGQDVVLRDAQKMPLAIMTVEEIYQWNSAKVAERVLGTRDLRHPLVAEMHRWSKFNISGSLRVIRMPRHYDFKELRLTPSEVRGKLQHFKCNNVIAFQTMNPLHRGYEEITKRAVAQLNGALLLHPVVGLTKPGDLSRSTRILTYKTVAANYYDHGRTLLSLLPLATRMAGPREALWQALIHRNYGATHMILERNHASPGLDSDGRPFYPPYSAQEVVEQFSDEIEVKVIRLGELAYLPSKNQYKDASQVPEDVQSIPMSGTEVDKYLSVGSVLPQWLVRPEVAEILEGTALPRHKQGVCIWFTGLSGSGKSTTAEVLTVLLQEHGREVTLLDGDELRIHISRGLGNSKADRDAHIRRIGYIAAQIVRHGGAVVCAAVSPYRATRNDVRNMIGANHFVEIYVNTSLEECEKRDTKGMYAQARRGELTHFSGIDDPYEPPQYPELTLDTNHKHVNDNAREILEYLVTQGFIKK
jgi:sulfate adenylyltransferase